MFAKLGDLLAVSPDLCATMSCARGHSYSELAIVVSPQFAIEDSSGFSVFNVWAAQNPKLDRARAGVGVYLMQQAFRRTAPNYDYKMFDAVDGKTYSAVNNTIPQAIQNVARTVIDLAKST